MNFLIIGEVLHQGFEYRIGLLPVIIELGLLDGQNIGVQVPDGFHYVQREGPAGTVAEQGCVEGVDVPADQCVHHE